MYIFASFELQINQILQLQRINPALIRVVNTHIFLPQVPNAGAYMSLARPGTKRATATKL